MLQAGERKAAVASFGTAIDLAPKNHRAYSGLSELLFAAGEYEKVTHLLEGAVAAGAANGQIYFTLGNAHYAAGRLRAAREAYANARALDSDNLRSSSAGESHPHALTEPDVSLSAHPALIVQPLVEAWSNVQRAAGRVERPVQATCGLGEAHGAWIYTSAASTSPRSG